MPSEMTERASFAILGYEDRHCGNSKSGLYESRIDRILDCALKRLPWAGHLLVSATATG
jgi:hypothetical protein